MEFVSSDQRVLQHGHLERSHQSLAEEVHQLEGQLADFNLAHDKVIALSFCNKLLSFFCRISNLP